MQADAFFPFLNTPSSEQPNAMYKLIVFNVPTPSSLVVFYTQNVLPWIFTGSHYKFLWNVQ